MNIDLQIRTLFEKLAERKKKVEELKVHQGKAWKTNCTFRLLGSTSTVNIQTASHDTIVECAVQLCIVTGASAEAAKRLDIACVDKQHGYPAAAWFDDFQKRLATINIRDEEAQVQLLEQRLNSVLSPEERRRIEVELLLKEI